MPVNWQLAHDAIRLLGVPNQSTRGIEEADAVRQTDTARSILESLRRQPGIVLADEVGMGKTYVAMAVIASVLLSTKGQPPVIVMTPPGLASKWKAEWQQFKTTCLVKPEILKPFRDSFANNPTDFFRAIGDSDRAKRSHLIWISTRCFSRGLQDPWIKLALCRIARSKTKMAPEVLKRFCKWADDLIRMRSNRRVTPDLIDDLMVLPLADWKGRLVADGVIKEEDPDPVPLHLIRYKEDVNCSDLVKVLRDDTIPGRQGGVSDDRLKGARSEFTIACHNAYKNWVNGANWNASLFVLDEAHHAKNDDTSLAQLFRLPEWDEVQDQLPLFQDKFQRMLFLTATPFQLGHSELINVLGSFASARWSGAAAPDRDPEKFKADLKELKKRLDENQKCGRRLDELWSKVTRQRIAGHAPLGEDLTSATETWWKQVETGAGDPYDQQILEMVKRFREAKDLAQSDSDRPWSSLRTWIIRHNRDTMLRGTDGSTLPRRIGRHGQAIRDESENPAENGVGLDLGDGDPLPFLLAARAQGELAGSPGRGRAFFAEGLASSYEAFHHTREERGIDVRDIGDETEPVEQKTETDVQAIVPVDWYEEQIESFVPNRDRFDEAGRHPKLKAVVKRVVHLWKKGEKVLVFCTYRQTAKALRNQIRESIAKAILELTNEKRQGIARTDDHPRKFLQRASKRLADRRGPLHRELMKFLDQILRQTAFQNLTDRRAELTKLLAGYARSPSFIARYLPAAVFGDDQQVASQAFTEAINQSRDASGTTFQDRIEEFLRFAQELDARGQRMTALSEEDASIDPLGDYVRAVTAATGVRKIADEEDESGRRGSSVRALAVVRMVYGGTSRETRERVMLAFNSPLFPEILISSSVLGEGVDLHRFCRFVIHHDLSWNPSVIEQRTGRVDRICCRAETTHRSIVVYEPYISESADEKLFRVLRDRERWFQVVMGQKFSFDERSVEAIADRVPLPKSLAESLMFDLRRYTSTNPRGGDR